VISEQLSISSAKSNGTDLRLVGWAKSKPTMAAWHS